jgi:hypothetical protein
MSLSMPAAEPNTRAYVGNVGEFEQPLDGPVFAERPMQDGEDHIDIDGAVGGAAERARVALKWGKGSVGRVYGLGRHDYRLTARQQGCSRGRLRIASAQMLRFIVRLALQ